MHSRWCFVGPCALFFLTVSCQGPAPLDPSSGVTVHLSSAALPPTDGYGGDVQWCELVVRAQNSSDSEVWIELGRGWVRQGAILQPTSQMLFCARDGYRLLPGETLSQALIYEDSGSSLSEAIELQKTTISILFWDPTSLRSFVVESTDCVDFPCLKDHDDLLCFDNRTVPLLYDVDLRFLTGLQGE